MRYFAISALLLLGSSACEDEDANTSRHADSGASTDHHQDASTQTPKDAGAQGSVGTLRPSLPRAPKSGLPAELRPPR